MIVNRDPKARGPFTAFAEVAGHFSGPLVVMGDFNATPWSHAVRRIERLTGTRRIGGIGRTWHGYPTPLGEVPVPLGLPIDHILISPGIGVLSVGTLEIPGSDHLAVRAVLTVPTAEEAFARAAPALSVAGDGTGGGDAPRHIADGQGQ